MKKYLIRSILIMIITALTFSFQFNSFAEPPVPSVNHPRFSSYEEMIEAYNDNSKMWSFEVLTNYWLLSYWENDDCLDFDEYCSIYNAAIESNSFIYFTEHPEKTPDRIQVDATSYGAYSMDYIIDNNVRIHVDFPRNKKEEEAIEKEDIKKFIDLRNPYYFDGCDGCRKKMTFTDYIVINNQKCICFWVGKNQIKIIYDNRILTVNPCDAYKLNETKGELTTEEYFREFLSDLVFSEYVPPEGDGGETGEETAITE